MRPRLINPDVPDVGDIVKAEYKRGTLKVSVEGQIANVRRAGPVRICESECGAVIYRTDTVKAVYMVREYQPQQPGLFD